MTCSETDPCNQPSDGKETSKIFLFLQKPGETITAGFTHIAIEHSHDRGATWKRNTKKLADMILIEADRYNYVYVVNDVPEVLYRPVLVAQLGTPADLPQAAREATDTSYEEVWTIDEIKRVYLTGVDLTDDNNVPFPDEMFAHGIRTAIDRCEHELDLYLTPTRLVETYDFERLNYEKFMFVQLRARPTILVESCFLEYPAGQNVLTFPPEWFRLDRHAGELRILPSSGTFSQFLIGSGGGFLPVIFGGNDMVPDLINITYFAGFELGVKTKKNPNGLPNDIKELVGKWATFGPLDVAGDLTGGAAVASKSISYDGLSQSLNTTSSPMYAGYGARLERYDKEIKAMLPVLRKYYKGGRMVAV